MIDFIQKIVLYLSDVSFLWYLFLFFVVFFENLIWIWFFIPGTIILGIFWMLIWMNLYSFFTVIVISFLWNLLGSLISFYVWWKISKKISKKNYKQLKIIIDKIYKYKTCFILFWKFIFGIKETVNFIAWIFHTKINKIILWNSLWAFFWSLLYTYIWYVFYNSFELTKIRTNRIEYLILLLFIFVLFLTILRIYFIKFWKLLLKLFIVIWRILSRQVMSILFFKKFIKNHFKLVSFIKNRVNLKNFNWLPLTLFIFILCYLLFAYIWFTKSLLNNIFLNNLDLWCENLLNYFRHYKLIKFFLFLNFFWEIKVIFLFFVLISIYLVYKRKLNKVIWLWISLIVILLIVFLTKNIIARHRPELAVYEINWYSFPSIHSALLVGFYWFIVLYFIKNTNSWNKRVNFLIVWIFIVIIVSFARLYLDVNYLSDILWWYLVGLIWLSFWFVLSNIDYIKSNLKIIEKSLFIFVNKKCTKLYIVFFMFMLFFIFPIMYKSYVQGIKIVYFNDINNIIKISNIIEYLNKNQELKYTKTITWRKTEPLNFIFLSRHKNDLVNIFEKAGFYLSDKIAPKSVEKMWLALYDKIPYQRAPMLPLFWNNKVQLFWFQQQDKNDLKFRHHIRIWDTHLKQWEYYIFVGCWVYDNWIKWHITHKIDPDLDAERDYIFNQLKKTNLIYKYKKIQLVSSTIWKNFSYDVFYTDWKAYIIWIK